MVRKIWTQEDILFLKQNIKIMTCKELANHFSVSKSSIMHKISKLGISKKKETGEFWTDSENFILTKHFEYAPKNMLLKMLPLRSWSSILQHGIKTLKLNRKSQDKYYIKYDALSDWTELSSYLLGLTLSDGYIKRNSGPRNENALQFELASYDIDILEKIKKYLNFEGPILYSNRGTVKLCISNTRIIDDLIYKGIPISNKTKMASFPQKIPESMLNHFIRGLFDGDGSVFCDSNDIVFQLLGTKPLLFSIKNKLPQFFHTVNLYDRSKNGTNIFCLKLKGKNAEKLYKWLYDNSTIYLQRKYNKYCQIINSPSYGKPCEDMT